MTNERKERELRDEIELQRLSAAITKQQLMLGLTSKVVGAFTPSSKQSNRQTSTTIQQSSSASTFPVTNTSITNPTFSTTSCTSIPSAPTSPNQSVNITASQTLSSNAAPHPTSAPVSNPTSIPFNVQISIPFNVQTSIPFTV